MSERDGYAPGVPCWVDTWQDDADAAASFYSGVFGWDAARGEYSLFQLRGRDVAGLGSPLQNQPAWTTYVWVDSADETAAKARAAGGTIVAEPFDSLDGGRMAVIADPGGAVVAVWELGEHRGAQLVNEPGAWSMSMLSTPDTETAAAFYSEVFGWSTDSFEDFTMFRLEGYVGGEPTQPVPRDVIAVMAPGEQAAWTPDFWVADADAAAARAGELGGQIVMGPFDTPVGRTAVLADPVGAVFSVSKVGPPA
jgi:predicted enzyme related to lactoylglutathione lyase